MRHSNNISQVRQKLKQVTARDFRDRSLFNLTREFEHLSRRIDLSGIEGLLEKREARMMSVVPTGTGTYVYDPFAILSGEIPHDLEDENFRGFKKDVETHAANAEKEREDDRFMDLTADCSANKVIFVIALGQQGEIVNAESR